MITMKKIQTTGTFFNLFFIQFKIPIKFLYIEKGLLKKYILQPLC